MRLGSGPRNEAGDGNEAGEWGLGMRLCTYSICTCICMWK